MANLVWAESAYAATQGLEWWASTSGTVTRETSIVKYGPSSIKTNAGRLDSPTIFSDIERVTFWWYSGDISADKTFFVTSNTAGGSVLILSFDLASGKLKLSDNVFSKLGSTSVASNTWYRIAFTWNLTTTSNWSAKVYLTTSDGISPAADISASNTDATLLRVGTTKVQAGSTAATIISYFSPFVFDDGSDLSDPGDLRATYKGPNANSTNTFDTEIGSTANRYDHVNERPLAESKGWSHIATTTAEESYGIQNAATGDIDLTGKTIVGRLAFLWGKYANPYAKITSSAVSSAVKATTTDSTSVTVTSGDLIYIAFADQILGTALSPPVKQSGTSTIGTVTALTTATSTVRLNKWWCKATGSGTLVFRVTHDNSANNRELIVLVLPDSTASPADTNPACTTDGTSQHDGPLTGTLAQANEIIVEAFAFAGPNTDTIAIVGSSDTSAETGGTTGGGATTNVALRMNIRPVNATTTVSASMTNTTANRAAVQGISSFKLNVDPVSTAAKLVNNGSDVSITLGSAAALFTSVSTSATYPATAGVIGMKANGIWADTILYECGMLIVYEQGTPAAGTRGAPFGHRSTAFNGGKTFHGIIN